MPQGSCERNGAEVDDGHYCNGYQDTREEAEPAVDVEESDPCLLTDGDSDEPSQKPGDDSKHHGTIPPYASRLLLARVARA